MLELVRTAAIGTIDPGDIKAVGRLADAMSAMTARGTSTTSGDGNESEADVYLWLQEHHHLTGANSF